MNPYQTIWLNPVRTYDEFIVNNRQQSLFSLPILIVGLSLGLDLTPEISGLLNEDFVWWSLLISFPGGIGIAFLVLGLILPGLVKLTGKIWKGKSTMRQMVNVYSLSSIPFGILLVYQIILLISGMDFDSDNISYVTDRLLWLWSSVLLIIGVARIQSFSYGIAFLNIIISYLPILLIAILKN